jgi:hypothetical protein
MTKLNAAILQLLDQPTTTRVVATVDESGKPYAAASPFLHAGEGGQLVHLELLEKSATNRNLLRSLWFDTKVSVALVSPDGSSYVIPGRPVKALISGPVFRGYYQQVRAQLGDADLATVWLIEPEAAVNETYAVRKLEEEERFPFSVHLDRLLVPPVNG